MSAIMFNWGNGTPFCTTGSHVDGQPVVDNSRTAVLFSREFRDWHGRGPVTSYAEVHRNIASLLASLQAGKCLVVVESVANIAALTRELEQDGALFSTLPSPLGAAQLADAYAVSLGFADNAELLLAAYMRAGKEDLQDYYRLGIAGKPAYDEALARMRAEGYGENPLQLLAFLKDEAEGARRNLPATAIRDERKAATAAEGSGTAAK
jgi:hypothetical protein